jgi:hypothetical protein
MIRKITWTILAAILAGVVVGALLWLRQRERERQLPVEIFIPSSSAVVLQVSGDARLPGGLPSPLAEDILHFRRSPLYRVVDTLARAGVVNGASISVALRVEGERVRFLYVLERGGLLNRGDLFPGSMRERGRVYTLAVEGEEVHGAVSGGVVLLSDSREFIEDALEEARHEETSEYREARRYFSAAAGIKVYLGSTCFTDLLPLYLKGDVARSFAWGALDGYLTPEGASFNGFMHPGDTTRSLPGVLRRQRAGETRLDEVLPADVKSVSVLRLSDTRLYLEDLETYRSNAGIAPKARERERRHARWFGEGTREEWQDLSRGEIAKGVMEVSPAGEEEGVMIVHLKSGGKGELLLKKMMEHHARQSNAGNDPARHLYQIDREQVHAYTMPATDFCSVTWGDLFDGMPARYAFVLENYLVLASSHAAARRFVTGYFRRSSIRDVAWYKRVRERLGVNHTWMHVAATAAMLPRYRTTASGPWAAYLREKGERLAGISSWGYRWSGEEGMLYTSLVASVEKVEEPPARVMWQTRLEADVALKPAIVKNHVTGERELLVQDRLNNLYLVSDAGLVLWRLPLQEAINSEIYQVDFYRNGKLQYLFSSPTRLYLIDRNGAYLPRYPLPLRSRCEVGITLFDYENDRDYRVAAPGEDRNLYLFTLDGNPVKGWEMPRSDNPVASRLYHFKAGDKDYLVFADRYRLYILDRRGNHRVKVDHLFDIGPNTPLLASRRGGKTVILFAGARQEVWWVDLEGKVGSWKGERESPDFHFNAGDVNADGEDDWIFTEGPILRVHDHHGLLLLERSWDDAALGYPYLYSFSARDTRVGMLDETGGRLLLEGKDTGKGFPVAGITPFSIAPHEGTGFYLFAGSTGGYLLKYRVQQ